MLCVIQTHTQSLISVNQQGFLNRYRVIQTNNVCTIMAVSKFLEERWRKGFRFVDVDKNGVLTKEDFQQWATCIGERSGATAEDKAKLTEEYMTWAEILQPSVSGQPLTEDMFVQSHAELYRDPENHARVLRVTISTIFDTIDLNKDGLISPDELKIYYEGFGFKDEGFVRKVFHQLDGNKDGYIDREELITALLSYWSSEDENVEVAFLYDPAAL